MDLPFDNEAENSLVTINLQQLQSLRESSQIVPETSRPAETTVSVGSVECQDNLSLRGRLVDLMPSYPALWCITMRSYKDLTKKDAAWKELSLKLNETSKFSVLK